MKNILIAVSEISISDWIQVIAIIVSLTVAVVSIIQTQKSLKITKENIRSESRPYLSFYLEYADINKNHKFFSIKNFGSSSAKILDIKIDKKLDDLNEKFKFNSLIGGTIAPGQRFTSYIKPEYKETINVTLSYLSLDGIKYIETFDVKTDIASSLLWLDQDTPEKAIRESAKILSKSINKSRKDIKDLSELM